MSTSFSCHVITTVWPMVEAFLDLTATTAMARACRALHEIIIDADSQKVKVSHFKLGPCSRVHDNLPLHITVCLERIHFPSLRKLNIEFPETINSPHQGAWLALFSVCTANLAYAHRLETLEFHARGGIFSGENAEAMASWIKIFGNNLANCRQLKHLDVTAEKSYVIEEFMSIADVMNALVPTIHKRKETLETMYLHTSLTCDDSLTEFFIAILCLKNVQYLIISIYECGNLFDSLLEAAAHVCPRNAKPTGIRRLALSLQPCTLQMHSPHSFTPLLEYYSECHAVNNIHFDLPKICWEDRDSFLAWRKIVLNMPKTLDFTCDFDLYEDSDDKVTKVLEDIISGHQSRKEIRYVSIRNLYNADRKCFDKMVQLLAVAGVILHSNYPDTTGIDPDRVDFDDVEFSNIN